MKYLQILILLLLLPNTPHAKDNICLANGQQIKAGVTEINLKDITCKSFDFDQRPHYSIVKSKVMTINYCSGEVLQFDKADNTDPKSSTKPTSQDPDSKSDPKKISFGIVAGLNAATGLYDYKNGPEPPALSLLPAPTIGVEMDLPLGSTLSLLTTVSYRGKGDLIDMQDWIDEIELPPVSAGWIQLIPEGEGTLRTYVGYIEGSLCPVINFSEKFRLGLGGYVGLGIHGKEKADYTISFYADGNLEKEEIRNSERSIEFSDIVAIEDNDEVRYFNRMDYGFTGFIGFGNRPLSYRFSISYGRQTWEPNLALLGTETQLTETYHITGMFAVTYWLN